MRKHWKYVKYLALHKWFVFLAGRKVGVSLWQLLIHDWSKLLPSEWLPYAIWFSGEPHKDGDELAFNRAWLLHQNRNPHHWQFWLLTYDRGDTEVLEMPDKYVREMVADWAGAGRAITGKWEPGTWYLKNRDKMKLHPKTRAKVEFYLHYIEIGYDGLG